MGDPRKNLTFRTWAAVRVDGVVRAEIRDFTSREEYVAWTFQGDDVRWWQIGSYEPGEDPNEPEEGAEPRHADGCGPERPCARCEKRARRWWVEWARRKAEQELEPPKPATSQPSLFGRR
jgi:hypothetical protein